MLVVSRGETILRAIHVGPRPAGGTVTLSMRLERLRFSEIGAAPAGWNWMRVTVSDTIFAGERRRYVCACDDGTSIVLKAPSSAIASPRAPGRNGGDHVALSRHRHRLTT